MRECSFRNSEIEHTNLNGLSAEDCDFSNSSLRHTRFINARLMTVRFIDCDLKGALFCFSVRHEVSFKHSNYQEAFF